MSWDQQNKRFAGQCFDVITHPIRTGLFQGPAQTQNVTVFAMQKNRIIQKIAQTKESAGKNWFEFGGEDCASMFQLCSYNIPDLHRTQNF